MNIQLGHAIVTITPSGLVKIFSNNFEDAEVKKIIDMFNAKKVAGRSYIDKHGNWVFEPYNTGANASKVLVKELVGQIVATRSVNNVKFALSLPASMTKHQVVMSVIEQYGMLIDALQKDGLYERLKQMETTPSVVLQDAETAQAA